MDDTEPLEPEAQARLARPVTLRALLVAVALTALLSIAAGVLISSVVVGHGPPGPRGEPGPAGDAGPSGADADAPDVEIDPEQVYSAVEDDPGRVAAAVQDELDPSPSDVADDLDTVRSTADDAASAVEEVRGALDGLCGELRLAPALSDAVLSC